MKYILYFSLILLCFSQLKCHEIDESEDFETEEVDPVDTNEEDEQDEKISVPDLDLIPSFKTPNKKGKGKEKDDSDDSEKTPLTSLVSTMERGTIGLLGTIRNRFASSVQEVGSHIEETKERMNKRFQNGISEFMQGFQHQFEG